MTSDPHAASFDKMRRRPTGMRRLKARHRLIKMRVKRLVREAARTGQTSFEFQTSTGSVIVHPSTRRPGWYQITSFGTDGIPWGHLEAPTLEEALQESWQGANVDFVPEYPFESIKTDRSTRYKID